MDSPGFHVPHLPMSTEDRLAELEAKLTQREAKIDQTLDAMSQTLALLARAVIPNSPTIPQPVLAPPTTSSRSDLKPALPPSFDGDRLKGKGFINACQAYFRLRPDQFRDEQTKIQWAMTYMNQGRAQKWVNRVYQWESTPANVGTPYFHDWSDFRSKFRAEFYPLHSDAVATNKLEGTSYFQGRRTVDDYLDEFRDLISESGYTDPKTIVVKFRRGLNPTIADAVATMAAGRPDDLDPDGWYEAAIRIDQNQAANAAFRSAHASHSKPPPTSSTFPTRPAPSAPAKPFHKFAHLSPTPGNPVPMDVDALKKTGKTPLSCYRCGKLGHISSQCPNGFDICHLDRGNTELLLEQLSAHLDMMNVSAASAQVSEESEEVSDFLEGSR
jgi:hypothetical protein